MFSLYPFWYLGAVLALGLGYLVFLWVRRRSSGEWQHGRYAFRAWATLGVFTLLFWGPIQLFTGVTRRHHYSATYAPYHPTSLPSRTAYTFTYVDHPASYEHVLSDSLHLYLESVHPATVQLELETTWDFGRLRAYSVQRVDSVRVNGEWIGGTPPWDDLRQVTKQQ
ncbi:MAG: hypothetical protein EXR93_11190 [Gemmatimonadetes bacterium]|nr:hypothetical protein [Gemmatimonadota bacterium]